MIRFENLKDTTIPEEAPVKVTIANNVVDINYCQHRNTKANITKLSKNTYVVNSTGEVKETKKKKSRDDSKPQVRESLKRLRDYINFNVVDVNNCKFLTLTYNEKMTDTKRLYKDNDKFMKRFRYRYGKVEYIMACEPHGNGSWHSHIIFIFDKKAPYIPWEELQAIWGHGNINVKKVDENVDNLGAYLTSHLSNMPLEEAKEIGIEYTDKAIKEIRKENGVMLDNPKYIVKGARLRFYPPDFNLYRTSRGIKPPKKKIMRYDKAKEKIGLGKPIYSKALRLTDDDSQFNSIVINEHYNLKRQ